jgi:hypothetical protein
VRAWGWRDKRSSRWREWSVGMAAGYAGTSVSSGTSTSSSEVNCSACQGKGGQCQQPPSNHWNERYSATAVPCKNIK